MHWASHDILFFQIPVSEKKKQRYQVRKSLDFQNTAMACHRKIQVFWIFPIPGCEQSGQTERNTGNYFKGGRKIQRIKGVPDYALDKEQLFQV